MGSQSIKTRLNTPLFIEMPIWSKESARSCTFMLKYSFCRFVSVPTIAGLKYGDAFERVHFHSCVMNPSYISNLIGSKESRMHRKYAIRNLRIQCCQCLWIVHSWLCCQFSLTFNQYLNPHYYHYYRCDRPTSKSTHFPCS